MADMIDTIPDIKITTTGSGVKIYTLPGGMVAYLKNLTITNSSSSNATVSIYSGNPSGSSKYGLITIIVEAGTTVTLGEKEIGGRKAIDDIYVVTDQQPINISGAVELR